ncbi:hypothetical protein [Nocardia wallacei]|uniref:hypothetical protein n=1 Tax=Nocardia wallacei TaxID=480035 RepID=UPI002455FA32|nr:hypothetical protein [Nocardia wallacei]
MSDHALPRTTRRLARRIDRDAETTRWWIAWQEHLATRSAPRPTLARVLALLFRIETARNDDHDLTAAKSYLAWCEDTAKTLQRNTTQDIPGLEMQWRIEAAHAGIKVIPALDIVSMTMLIVFCFGMAYCIDSLTLTTGPAMLIGCVAIYGYITHTALRTAVGPDSPPPWWTRWRPLLPARRTQAKASE